MADCQTLADCIHRACVWEATAIKAGNVHPHAPLGAMQYTDFVRSAEVIAPILANATSLGVGRAILEAVQATQAAVRCNTNLGIILLMAPLAAVPTNISLPEGIGTVLNSLTVVDTVLVYEAIRIAHPGGLGNAAEQDVNAAPSLPLKAVMALAADRDQIAREYATDFAWLVNHAVPQWSRESIVNACASEEAILSAVVSLQVWMLASQPDTLILRKSGPATAAEAQRRAAAILAVGGVKTIEGRSLFLELDQWMRQFPSQRNPGTTADLIAATLFAWLREQCFLT